jgi:hypothetical protein
VLLIPLLNGKGGQVCQQDVLPMRLKRERKDSTEKRRVNPRDLLVLENATRGIVESVPERVKKGAVGACKSRDSSADPVSNMVKRSPQ